MDGSNASEDSKVKGPETPSQAPVAVFPLLDFPYVQIFTFLLGIPQQCSIVTLRCCSFPTSPSGKEIGSGKSRRVFL
jgi:hypothetical protein